MTSHAVVVRPAGSRHVDGASHAVVTGPHRPHAARSTQISNRIAQAIIVATSAFALLDLGLLVSSLHH